MTSPALRRRRLERTRRLIAETGPDRVIELGCLRARALEDHWLASRRRRARLTPRARRDGQSGC